jgi:hypothetical protein
MSTKKNYKRVFQVNQAHEERNRHEAERFSTRPALFPDGTPGVALASNGNIFAVLPEQTAARLMHHMRASIERAKGELRD